MEGEILGQSEEEWEAPKSWPFRMWEKIKNWFPSVKRVIEIALLIGAFFYLIVSMRRSMFNGGQKRQFDRIGTLEIHATAQPEETEETEEKGFKPWQVLVNLLNE